MREHLDLLFEQHLSRLVACCVYGTTRKHNVVVSIKVRHDHWIQWPRMPAT